MKYWPLAAILFTATLHADLPPAKIAERLERKGDEIMVCGQLYHTTTRVILWTDPGGYDAYRVEPRFAQPHRRHRRTKAITATAPANRGSACARRGCRPLRSSRSKGGDGTFLCSSESSINSSIHFDAAGTSRRCFEILQDRRGLSVQFMLDLDGTIYQTLDVKESAFHATIANGRSIGIEVANIGAYPENATDRLTKVYKSDQAGQVFIASPARAPPRRAKPGNSRLLRPARNEIVRGTIQGQKLTQYDFTPEQYESLAKLAATLCKLFPKIRPDYPRDASGALIPHKLPDADYASYQGILGPLPRADQQGRPRPGVPVATSSWSRLGI